jgi:hypothetical protein
MKLGIKILNTDPTLNNFKYQDQLHITKGSDVDFFFQLFDEDRQQRYMPAAGTTVAVAISRYVEYLATDSNVREEADYSVTGNATQPFPLDGSIWKFPLTAAQTANITSSAVKITMTEASKIKIVKKPMAIVSENASE